MTDALNSKPRQCLSRFYGGYKCRYERGHLGGHNYNNGNGTVIHWPNYFVLNERP